MNGEQQSFLDDQGQIPSAPVDAATGAVLDLVADDDVHARDRAAVVEAILADGRAHGGEVDPNRVRTEIPSWVYPRVVGATYRVLAGKGVIVPDGWVISTDTAGRNSGRPARRYRLANSTADAA